VGGGLVGLAASFNFFTSHSCFSGCTPGRILWLHRVNLQMASVLLVSVRDLLCRSLRYFSIFLTCF